jgi:hypothetical protein
VRKAKYYRLTGKDRQFIKGQKCTRQGGVWAALGLRAGRLGSSLLRALARLTEVAAPETLREVRQDDRPALGRYRGLLQAGEQGRLGIRRRREQQDPRDSATQLRPTRREVPAPQSPHLHARPDMKPGRNHPLGKEMPQIYMPIRWADRSGSMWRQMAPSVISRRNCLGIIRTWQGLYWALK